MNDYSSTCPLCDSPGHPWLRVPDDWRRPGTGPHKLDWCDTCSIGWLNPRPIPESIAAFYDVEYYTHNADGSAPAPRSLGRKILERIAWQLDTDLSFDTDWFKRWLPDAHARAVDLGAGSGVYSQMLVDAGAGVVAVETDPKARAVIEQRGIRAIDGLCESLPDSVERGAFDLALLSHVLEHTLDVHRALEQSASTLKPGGVLVVEVPNNDAIGLTRAGDCWHWLDVPRHLNFFTRASLVAAVERAGLTVERTEFVGYTRQFQKPWADAERHIASALEPDKPARFTTSRGQAGLLARTALSRPEKKYDSVRVIARR